MSTTPDTSASPYILVEASHHGIVGMTEAVEGWPVQYVHASSNPTIRFSKYVKDYSQRSARPWKIGARSYSTLGNALRALSLQAN